jgi:Trk-type K+ transport system membrane component
MNLVGSATVVSAGIKTAREALIFDLVRRKINSKVKSIGLYS